MVKATLSMNRGAQVPAGGEVSLWCEAQLATGSIDYVQMMIIRLDGAVQSPGGAPKTGPETGPELSRNDQSRAPTTRDNFRLPALFRAPRACYGTRRSEVRILSG